MLKKIFKALCSAMATVALCFCCGIDIKTSMAVIVASIGCTLITDSAIERADKKDMPTTIDWIEYGIGLALIVILTIALHKANFTLLIISGALAVVLLGVFIYENHILKKAKAENVVNL